MSSPPSIHSHHLESGPEDRAALQLKTWGEQLRGLRKEEKADL